MAVVAPVWLGLACLLASGGNAAARGDAALRLPHALVLHAAVHERLARQVGDASEFAYRALAEEFGVPRAPLTIYVYGDTDEMVEGLMSILGWDREEAETIAMVGISARTRNTLHVHPKVEQWGPFLQHAVVHEHLHGVLEDRYGTVLEFSARWLYEGLGEYAAHRALEDELRDFEERWNRTRYRVAFRALLRGRLPRLEEMSGKSRWLANIRRSREAWDLQYATAYAAVTYLIDEYGFERVEPLLSEIADGVPIGAALERVLGVSERRFEARFLAALFLEGAFRVHRRYTAAAGLLLVASLAVILFLRFAWLRSRPDRGVDPGSG